ncbi:MAG: histone deacetylase [Thermoanaerobacterales bacterium]|nr:histone deacetylase [Thermoanaerobacterales bacterium]
MPTGLVFFPAFDWAITPTHPEREERLLYTRDQLFEEGIMDLPELIEYKPRMALKKDIARAHFCVPDIETQITDAHLYAAGGALVLADALMNKEIDNGFALVRPPGHHAMRVVHGNRGFCNIHNEAIMVEYLRKKYGVQRIAIVDTDVHHGDGTQDIYYHDPDVLFISYHQDGRTLYPGSGFCDELGGPAAFGMNINIPLQPYTTDEGILYLMDNLVLPILDDFKPELIINSAGQDNHYTDPLANMRFTARGYAMLNEKLSPDLAVLEGGYAIESALPYVNTGIILAMAGLDYSWVREPDYKEENFKETKENMDYIIELADYLWRIWKDREQLAEQRYQRKEKFEEINRHIYYDTDGIREQQNETVRLCDHCPGYQIIRSRGMYSTGKSRVIEAVAIHHRVCKTCQEEARGYYEERKREREGLDVVYLQDKPQDRYYQFSADGEIEILD